MNTATVGLIKHHVGDVTGPHLRLRPGAQVQLEA